MSESELLEHYWNGQEMAIESFLAYITILSGYLVVSLHEALGLTWWNVANRVYGTTTK
jgi:hypothetical protein